MDLWISCISLVLSLGAIAIAVCDHIQNDRLARNNLRAENCSLIFNDFLINKIPAARKEIRIDSACNRLEGINSLCQVLKDMQFSALYYSFDDPKFYGAIKATCQNLEDELVRMANQKYLDESEQKECKDMIQKQIERIYKLIDQKHIGKKIDG